MYHDLFVQVCKFVALCYYEHFSVLLKIVKETPDSHSLYRPENIRDISKDEAKLLNWLRNTLLYVILQWFDVVENVRVSSKLQAKRWNSEVTNRDALFVRRLIIAQAIYRKKFEYI